MKSAALSSLCLLAAVAMTSATPYGYGCYPPYPSSFPYQTGGVTTVYQIGRICTQGHSLRWLTILTDYCCSDYGRSVGLVTARPDNQHWVKVFDPLFSQSNLFHIVSFPRLDYVLKATTITPKGASSTSVVLTAERLPAAFYVHGATFKRLGSDYTFQDRVAVTGGTIQTTWNYIQHPGTGYYLDCLLNHPAQCGKAYDPVVLTAPNTYTPYSYGGPSGCTCTVDNKLWRYFD